MVDGETKVERDYCDPITEKMIPVSMTVRDHIFFDFLKRLESAIIRKSKK